MKPESENKPEGRYVLKIDTRHFFPGGHIPERLLEAAEYHKRAEIWAYYLECDVKVIEEQARRVAESTTMSYCEAINEVIRETLNGKVKPRQKPLRHLLLRHKPARLNRAQRRKAQRERRRNHGKR